MMSPTILGDGYCLIDDREFYFEMFWLLIVEC